MKEKKSSRKTCSSNKCKCGGSKGCAEIDGSDMMKLLSEAGRDWADEARRYSATAVKLAEALKVVLHLVDDTERKADAALGMCGGKPCGAVADACRGVNGVLGDDFKRAERAKAECSTLCGAVAAEAAAVDNYVKNLVAASGYALRDVSFSVRRVPQMDTPESICLEFEFRREEPFGRDGMSLTHEAFRTNVYPKDKARSVREFDANVGSMGWFEFPVRDGSGNRKECGKPEVKTDGKTEKAQREVPALPSASHVKKCLLAGSMYDIPQGRLVVRFLRTDRKHGNHVYGLSFHPKSVRSYRPGERQSPENAVLNLRISGDTGSRICARFDKAVAGLKTMKFPRKK